MKRRIGIIMLCLVLGAVFNVLVAWTCWLMPRWRLDQGAFLATRAWPEWAGADWPDPVATRTYWNTYVTLTRTSCAERVPRPFAGDAPATLYAQWGAGLPLRSMGAEYGVDSRPPGGLPIYLDRGELALPGWIAQRLGNQQVLPVRPLFLGFAANTLVYGAVFWLVVTRVWTFKRRYRCRNALCERCGYPIGVSSVCSECGAPLGASTGRSP